MRDTFKIVRWPDVQFLMDKPGFRENSHLINSVEGINEYGSSAYLVDSAWLEKVTGPSPERERLIIVSITDISPQGDAYCSILTSGSPEDALKQLRGYIDTEVCERGIELEPDYDDLLDLLSSDHGNECSKPEEIEYEGSGAGEFIIAVKILGKTAKTLPLIPNHMGRAHYDCVSEARYVPTPSP